MSIEHEYTDEIVCPWCGTVWGDSWENNDDSGSDECGTCEKPFTYTRDVSVTYSTRKVEPEAGAEKE